MTLAFPLSSSAVVQPTWNCQDSISFLFHPSSGAPGRMVLPTQTQMLRQHLYHFLYKTFCLIEISVTKYTLTWCTRSALPITAPSISNWLHTVFLDYSELSLKKNMPLETADRDRKHTVALLTETTGRKIHMVTKTDIACSPVVTSRNCSNNDHQHFKLH